MLTRGLATSLIGLIATSALLLGLLWLDQKRGGPATLLSRCNLLLTRSHMPSADVLVVGSSRTGTAIDPVAMQSMLTTSSSGAEHTVERLAIVKNPLRLTYPLVENYLTNRGIPQVIVLELMFQTKRSFDRLLQQQPGIQPEHYLYRRDLNLMTFRQILNIPSIAMPFTEKEGWLNLWHLRLRGVVLRTGALAYQFLQNPFGDWRLDHCDHNAWKYENPGISEFAFILGDADASQPPPDVAIKSLKLKMIDQASGRTKEPWQIRRPTALHYPYNFESTYRQGEVELLMSVLNLADRHNIKIVLLPLTLYGYIMEKRDHDYLQHLPVANLHVFDLYRHTPSELEKFWFDDAHIETDIAGELTTALLAKYLLDKGLIYSKKALSID